MSVRCNISGGASDPVFQLGLGNFLNPKREGDVFENRKMRIKRIELEHHGNAAVDRMGRTDVGAVDDNLAGSRLFEASDNAQER